MEKRDLPIPSSFLHRSMDRIINKKRGSQRSGDQYEKIVWPNYKKTITVREPVIKWEIEEVSDSRIFEKGKNSHPT